MSNEPLRKRFFVNGKPSAGLEMHAPYIKTARRLLAYVQNQMGVGVRQYSQRIALEDGAKIEAHMRHGQAEIWIDVPRVGGEKKPVKVEVKTPYLWVGARIAWERMGDGAGYSPFALILSVTEPSIDGKPQGIVSNVPVFQYPSGSGASGGAQWDGFDAANPRPPQVLPKWWSGAEPDAEGFPVNVQASQHGLYMTAVTMPHYTTSPFAYEAPGNVPVHAGNYLGRAAIYDPLDPTDAPAPRDMGAQSGDTHFVNGVPLWDAVAVLDPSPQMHPGDNRKGVLNLRQMREALDLPSGEGVIIGGNYIIKVGASELCTSAPLEVDIEVRVLKAPDTVTQRFQVTVPYGSDLSANIHPYGEIFPDNRQFCPHESRNNPHANWWQGAVLANPRSGAVRQESYYVPDHGFSPARFDPFWECTFTSTGKAAIFVGFAGVAGVSYAAFAPQVAARCVYERGQVNPFGFPEDYPILATPPYADNPDFDLIYNAAVRDVPTENARLYRYKAPPEASPPIFEATPFPAGFSITDAAWIEPLKEQLRAEGYHYLYFFVAPYHSWAEAIYLDEFECPII